MKKDYLIINRAKWRTGGAYNYNKTGKGHTALLNKQGYMCCLGFRCHQMGIPEKDLLGLSSPEELANNWTIPDLITYDGDDTSFTLKAIRINDDANCFQPEREKRIKKHFATIGVTVEFKGKYPCL